MQPINQIPGNDDPTAVAEQQRATYKTATSNSQGAAELKFKGTVNLWQLNGQTFPAYMADESTGALVTANPTENQFLRIGIQNDYTLAALQFILDIQIVYHIQWYDPKVLGQS